MRQNGLTLIELMILIPIVFIVGIVVIGGFSGGCADDWQRAEQDAKEFCKNIPGWEGNLQCAKKDSDNDGYCGCTCFLPTGERVKLDCGCERYSINNARGCKEIETIKMRLPKQNVEAQ